MRNHSSIFLYIQKPVVVVIECLLYFVFLFQGSAGGDEPESKAESKENKDIVRQDTVRNAQQYKDMDRQTKMTNNLLMY